MTQTPVATHSAQGSRLNRRGRETRRQILDVAVQCLATGGPEAVSANLIAKQAGVTWGTIQHQFGDSDGVWAAVLDEIAAGLTEPLPPRFGVKGSLARRVKGIVDWLWAVFDAPIARAVRNLRLSLPQDHERLVREFPVTAEAFVRVEATWASVFDELFRNLVDSPVKLRRVRNLLPGAIRGLRADELNPATDVEDAKKGLTEAIVAYLKE